MTRKPRRSLHLVTLTAAACLAVGLAACSSSGGAGGSNGAIKVGAINSLSGPAAFVGIPGQAGMKVAVEMVNKDPKTYLGSADRKLEVTYKDGDSTTSAALTLARTYVTTDTVTALIGPTITQQGQALAPYVQGVKVPTIIPYSNGTTMFTKGGKFSFSQGQTVTNVVTAALNATLTAHPDIKNVAVIWGNDNGGNIEVGNLAQQQLKAKGIKVLADPVTFAGLDYTSAIAKAKSAGVQAIYMGTGGPAVVAAMQQAQRDNFHPYWIGFETMLDPVVTENGGPEAEGAIMAADYNPGLQTSLNKSFVSAYVAATKQQPSNYAALGFQSIMNLAAAIKGVNGTVTRDNLADALGKVAAPSIVASGQAFKFDSQHLAANPAAVITIKNGQFVPLQGG